MGGVKSCHLKRRNSFDGNKYPLPAPFLCVSSLPVNKMDSSRSHSLASHTNSEVSSRLSTSMLADDQSSLSGPQLTHEQLALVQATWQAVLSDASNICLNFFLQLQRKFPHIKRRHQKRDKATSTPSLPCTLPVMTRNSSCYRDPQKQSELPQHALKLACCVDTLIASLIMHNMVVQERTVHMLEEAGDNLKLFLDVDNFDGSHAGREMAATFAESVRLIMVHTRSGGMALEWNAELQSAWLAFFRLLVQYLDGAAGEDLLDSVWH